MIQGNTIFKRSLFAALTTYLLLTSPLPHHIGSPSIGNAFGDASPSTTYTRAPRPKTRNSQPASTYVTLNNGMEFILTENHSNPMIASVIVVKTGSKDETLDNNGVSHMLEHLLFNGTENRTQEDIYDQMDFYGGYNNAHTARDFTSFMALLPAEHIDKGLDIQADMLFNSTIPAEKLDKEKGIVIEEIGKDMDREGNTNRRIFDRKLYNGTPYALPVLGTVNTITALTRSQIAAHYSKYYVPNNMVGLIIGDFDTPEMVRKLKNYFGHHAPKAIPFTKRFRLNTLRNNDIHNIKANVTRNHVTIGIEAPTLDDPDYFPFVILTELLNSGNLLMPAGGNDGRSADKGARPPEITHIHSEFIANDDIGTLNVFADLPADGDAAAALHEILLGLNRTANRLNVVPEDVMGIKTRIKTEEFFLRERLHYYGISRASMLANGGYRFMESYLNNIERVTLKQLKTTARKYLAVNTARFSKRSGKAESVNYVATLVEPLEKRDDISILHGESPGASDPAERGYNRIIRRKALDNGLTLITNTNNDSRVFAMHVLFKNRSLNEPAGKTGIADFLHRLLTGGTIGMDGKELKRRLESIGARLTLTDNPYIPYDNYRTSTGYSFIRLETIDDFYEEGMELLADMILHPRLDPVRIETVRNSMVSIIDNEDGTASRTARNLFYKELFSGTSLAKRCTGTKETVLSIKRDDLAAFHKRYFAPNNVIINIVSAIPDEIIAEKITNLFGDAKENKQLAAAEEITPKRLSRNKRINLERGRGSGKMQAHLYTGYPIEHINDDDNAAIAVLSSILSSGITSRLREEQGLAYSLGCSIQTRKGFGWLQCNVGTGKANIEHVTNEIVDIIKEYRNREFGQLELQKAVNKLKGRMMMRRLPRINQAYYSGIYEFYRDDYDYGRKLPERLNMVTVEDLKAAAGRYLQTEGYLSVVVE